MNPFVEIILLSKSETFYRGFEKKVISDKELSGHMHDEATASFIVTITLFLDRHPHQLRE